MESVVKMQQVSWQVIAVFMSSPPHAPLAYHHWPKSLFCPWAPKQSLAVILMFRDKMGNILVIPIQASLWQFIPKSILTKGRPPPGNRFCRRQVLCPVCSPCYKERGTASFALHSHRTETQHRCWMMLCCWTTAWWCWTTNAGLSCGVAGSTSPSPWWRGQISITKPIQICLIT